MISRVATMVLGLLAEGERHGYDILREMEERGMMRWAHVSRVAVYKALSRLESEGSLISWTEKDGNLPEKRIYAMTSEGQENLKDMVYAICASREPLRLDMAVGLAFISRLDTEEAAVALRSRMSFLETQVKRLRRERDIMEGIADDIFMDIIAYEHAAYRSELRCLKGIVASMEGGNSRAGENR